MTELLVIARQFVGSSTAVQPLGNGLINATYLVATADEPFVLQCLNAHVFPDPAAIMTNLAAIGRHLENKPQTANALQIPQLIASSDGRDSVRDERGQLWRATRYIARSVSLETLADAQQARQTGFALGRFHRLLSDLNPAELLDTLPGFHIAPAYLARYRQGLAAAAPKSLDPECAAFIERRQHLANDLEDAKSQGRLTLRIIHGDPKLNNFLFDTAQQKVIGLIDLDTVKPGLTHYDIGDCLRSCCHRADDTFDIDRAEAILSGYLAEAGHFFSAADYDYLYAAIRLLPFELGLRFYTDHLEGDRYFKVAEHGQNLQRAQAQFRLCANIIEREPAISRLIAVLRRKTANLF